jgi:hypothetical protein
MPFNDFEPKRLGIHLRLSFLFKATLEIVGAFNTTVFLFPIHQQRVRKGYQP